MPSLYAGNTTLSGRAVLSCRFTEKGRDKTAALSGEAVFSTVAFFPVSSPAFVKA